MNKNNFYKEEKSYEKLKQINYNSSKGFATLIIILVLPVIIFLAILGIEGIKTNIEIDKVKKQADQIVNEQIREFYPQKDFKITDIQVDVAGDWTKYVQSSSVKVRLKDNNEEYLAIVDTSAEKIKSIEKK